jgi:alkylation response protein AidB-like acyl-CoA dehydrogenase
VDEESGISVTYASSDELDLIRTTARRFLEDRFGLETVRDLMMSEEGFDRGSWNEIADLGWTGLAIGEEHGGAGYGLTELGVVLEEMGRLVTPGPFFASAVLATAAINLAGDDAQKAMLVPQLASGEMIATLAVFEEPRGWDLSDLTTSATADGSDWILDGAKRFVLSAHSADVIIVAARLGDGIGLFVVPKDASGLVVEQTPVLDPTRRQGDVLLNGVRVDTAALLGGGESSGALSLTLAIGTACLAAEQVGGAQRCLEMSVDYAKTRYQFGRPIGSFQSIKHRCAEMYMKVEHAKSTAYHAVRVVDDAHEFAVAAPLAGSICSEAYNWIAGETIQVHGGIGFTWEHDAHLYLKRAKASSLILGEARYQRRLLGQAIGL